MRNLYFKFGALCAAFAASLSAVAIDPPQIPAMELTDGGTYALVNKAKPNLYLYRTSWDGAFVLGPASGCGHAVAGATYLDYLLQAQKNDDGTWSFTQTVPSEVEGEEPVVNYMYLPFGSANINFADYFASWVVEPGVSQGFYKLTPGEGNNENAYGYYMHLNKGQEYVVISYLGAPWYPDYESKTETDELGDSYPLYDDRGAEVMADSTSLNWAFVDADAIPAYSEKMVAYEVIAPYEDAYMNEAGYEAGFKLGYDAAMAIYENPAYTSADVPAIKKILDSKVLSITRF